MLHNLFYFYLIVTLKLIINYYILSHRLEISVTADRVTIDTMTEMIQNACNIPVLHKDQGNRECNAEDTGIILCIDATMTPPTVGTTIWVGRGYSSVISYVCLYDHCYTCTVKTYIEHIPLHTLYYNTGRELGTLRVY